ncbi:MAG: DUF1566 domain-containing protein [Gammaproteobacteria bacterium]|nr:DUF1566 domain-containing protein [Gammaproteobacteria bacterium]
MILLSVAVWSVGSLAQKVGVGTNSPVAKLHVEVPSGITYPAFQVNQQGSAVPYLIIQPNGNVGIGVASPSEALDVSGNIQFSGALMPGGNAGAAGQVLVSQGPGVPPTWQSASAVGDNWGSQVAQTQAPIVGDGTSGNPITLQSGTANGEVLIYNGSQWQIRQAPWDSVCNTVMANMVQKWTGSELCNSQIYDDGTNVGIGTTTPTQKLDVAGNIQFSGALMPGGNAGSPGQVLVSNGPGVAPSWTTFSTGGSGISGCANCPTMYGPFVNTNGDSIAACSQTMTWKQCAQACVKSTYGGFNDWRMPSLEEVIYINTQVIDYNQGGCYHWTTTPLGYKGVSPSGSTTSAGNYYVFMPSDGSWSWLYAYNISYCRCVR